MDEMTLRLHGAGFTPSSDTKVFIGNYSLHIEPSQSTHLFKSKNNLASLYIEEIQDRSKLNSRWESFRKWKEIYSGYHPTPFTYYYLKLDSLFNVSINATLTTDKHIINIQERLPFYSRDIYTISEAQWLQVDEGNARILSALNILCAYLTNSNDKIYFPCTGKLYHRVLSPTERLAGFVHFWTEVKYNFAFFDHVPNLNWDDVLVEYLPRIQADQSNAEYYKLLTEVCAKLNDGHTNIYPPAGLMQDNKTPNVELRNLDDRIYIVNTSAKYKDLLPIGSQVTAVNGENVSGYIQKNLLPYISASTQYIKQNIATQDLLGIPKDGKLKIAFVTPNGTPGDYEFSDEADTTSWIIESPEWSPFQFEILKNNIAYLKINTFGNNQVVEQFINRIDSIGKSAKLILDLRENGGGNSSYGYEILKYFASRPIITSKWMTREHKAAYKAWGRTVIAPPQNQWEEECLATYRGDYWYIAAPDTIEPYYDRRISIPVVILFGNETASAAEDFLIAAEGAGLTETVGDFTYGSTGQPLEFRLPGGGSGRICTKKDTYPDGREFVGFGIKPKHIVKPGITDVLKHRDVVLEYALELK